MSRLCRRCRRLIPAGQGEILSAQEAGSGAPVAVYAHRGECPPEEQPTPRYTPPPAGFHR